MYVYDAFGQMAAEYSTASQTPACTTCYVVWDHLDSTRLVTDQNANVVARHDFLPFGEEIPANAAGRNSQWGLTTDVSQKLTGQIRDQETAMDYFNARYFGSALGRFTSPDPANVGADVTDPQTWNGYAYVRNNPLGLVDPSGMDGENTPTFSATGTACKWWQVWCWLGGGNDEGESGDGGLGGGYYGPGWPTKVTDDDSAADQD